MPIDSGVPNLVHEAQPLRLLNPGPTKTNEYSGGCRLFRTVAEGFGVNLTSQDIHDWEVLLGASFIIEALIDEQERDIRPLIHQVIEGGSVPGVADEAVRECKSYIDRQPRERQEDILDGLHQIGDFPKLYLQADNAEELIGVRLGEADIYANFLKLNPANQEDTEAREAFNNWVEKFSRSGYLVDSFFDLKQDYNVGKILVKPALWTRIALGKAATRELIPAIRTTPLSAIKNTAKVAMQYVLGQRERQKTSE